MTWRERVRRWGPHALIVLGCVLPWLALVNVLPWGADSTKWIGRGSLQVDWWNWVFFKKHFVGYRPVTALSYVLNHLTTGYAAWGYRLTDLALHAAGMLGLLALWRSWTRDRSWLGLLPVLLVLAHPATEEVVPYPTRRSYLLATCFGLWAAVAHARMLATDRVRAATGWSLLVAGLFGVAVLSNEVAYAIGPVMLLAGLIAPSPLNRGRALLGLTPTVAVGAGAVLARHAVLGVWGGGYQKRFFAILVDGAPKWTQRTEWHPWDILVASVEYTLVPQGVEGAGPLLPLGPLRDALVIALCVWLGWVGLIRPLARWRDPAKRWPLLYLTWAAGSTAIVVLSETWFWRQSHAVLLPLGLLVGHVLHEAWTERRRGAIPGVLGAVALLVAAIPFGSLAGGANLQAHATALAGNRVVRRMQTVLDDIEGPGVVMLAVPLSSSSGHVARIWGDRLTEGRGVRFRLTTTLKPGADARTTRASIHDGRLTLHGYQLVPDVPHPSVDPDGSLPITGFVRPGWPRTWLLAVDGHHAELAEIPIPAGAGAPPAPPPTTDEGDDEEEAP
ncbi:MAG: hypothetical protein H6738_13765 [Alphaproteobacteria bacterium]|nr:hypothetical protein [Alphaproteobacteria bacterium]MCB9697843.1 hypothetical protein [Alphaproteobacteria bacterium]